MKHLYLWTLFVVFVSTIIYGLSFKFSRYLANHIGEGATILIYTTGFIIIILLVLIYSLKRNR
jgi:hypothetical protein